MTEPRNQEFFSEGELSEEEVKAEVGRDAESGAFIPAYEASGNPSTSVIHRWRRRIFRGPLGRFVKQPPPPPTEPLKWRGPPPVR
jgi:hypothetical protein